MKKMIKLGSVATSALLVGAVIAPTNGMAAEVKGTSDTVITCESAHGFDEEEYFAPGFICDIDPDGVVVNGVEYLTIQYSLIVSLDGKRVGSKTLDDAIEPAPVYFGLKNIKFKFGKTYNVEYEALLANGDTAIIDDQDFTLETPEAPGKPKIKLKYGSLKQGIGKGYRVTWKKTQRSVGYQVQVRHKSNKFKDIKLSAEHASEFGRIPEAKDKTLRFRVRSWNAGGYSDWSGKWNNN